MKVPVHLALFLALSAGLVQITSPKEIKITLVAQDSSANVLYAIASIDENIGRLADSATLTYKSIGGPEGVTISFDNSKLNYLFVKNNADGNPFPVYGFNLKNTETFKLGGANFIVVLRNGALVYNRMENF